MKLVHYFIFLTCACYSLGFAQEEQLEQTHDFAQKKAEIDFAVESAQLVEKYSSALTAQKQKVQNAGDLDSTIGFQAELSRIEGAAVPTEVLSDVPVVAKMQQIFNRQINALITKRDVAQTDASKKYIEELKKLETSVTVAGDIDKALALRAKREAVESTFIKPDIPLNRTGPNELGALPNTIPNAVPVPSPPPAKKRNSLILPMEKARVLGAATITGKSCKMSAEKARIEWDLKKLRPGYYDVFLNLDRVHGSRAKLVVQGVRDTGASRSKFVQERSNSKEIIPTSRARGELSCGTFQLGGQLKLQILYLTSSSYYYLSLSDVELRPAKK